MLVGVVRLEQRQCAGDRVYLIGISWLKGETGIGRLAVEFRHAGIADQGGENTRFLCLAINGEKRFFRIYIYANFGSRSSVLHCTRQSPPDAAA